MSNQNYEKIKIVKNKKYYLLMIPLHVEHEKRKRFVTWGEYMELHFDWAVRQKKGWQFPPEPKPIIDNFLSCHHSRVHSESESKRICISV